VEFTVDSVGLCDTAREAEARTHHFRSTHGYTIDSFNGMQYAVDGPLNDSRSGEGATPARRGR